MIILLLPNNTYHAHKWWAQFPARIAEKAAECGMQTRAFYRRIPEDIPLWVDRETVCFENLQDPRWCWRTMRRLRREYPNGPVIIHLHGPPLQNALWPMIPCHFRSYWTFFTDHNAPTALDRPFARGKRMVKRLAQKSRLYPSRIVPVSEFNARVWRTHFPANMVKPIINGVRFPLDASPKSAPKDGIWTIAYLGRLIQKKGTRQIMGAIKQAIGEKLPVRFVMAGAGPESDYIESYIHLHSLSDCVAFMGSTDDLWAFYGGIHALLIPSQYEDPCPLVSIESMGYGVPAIYTRRGGLPEVQVNGETGIMLERGTPEEIVGAIRQMMSDPVAYERMSAAALQRAREGFTMDRMVDDYMDLYVRLMNR